MITEQRYAVMELPENGAYFSILTYTIAAGSGSCKVLKDRTIAVVDILEVKHMNTKMVTVNAEEMAQEISKKGSVALYGIYFDSGKADVKPESKDTLEQIAKFLTAAPDAIPVVHALARGTKRFGELRQEVGGVSQKMLTQCLRRLEAHGLVRRTVYPVVPPHVEYSLTPLGMSLNGPLAGICSWITRHGRHLERVTERAE